MKVHFIGIGGIGVSALAQYYLANGHQVSGSDLVSSEITEFLKKKGIKILPAGRQVPKNVDLVIYSPAVSNPPAEAKSYPEVLGELTKKYFTIAVSGTHGKSTTTAMIALILIKAGFDPTVILGTKLKEFGGSNFRMGRDRYLVIEADEWQASFLNYCPKIIVLTNIEREHLDYYRDLKHILRTYRKYIEHLPEDGVLVANGDDKNILKLISNFHTCLQGTCSFPIFNKFSIINFQTSKSRDAKMIRKIIKIPGEHNIYNSLAALTVVRLLKISDEVSFKTLSEYKGAWRRFEIKQLTINNQQLTIISDYGHHPTEIKTTLDAARERFPNKKIWCIFQPHQYQRTFYLFDDFVKVFSKAPVDNLIITDIYDVAGREKGEIKKKINSQKLVEKIKKEKVFYLPKEKIKNYLKRNLKGREVVIIMGAGDIYKLAEEFSTSNGVDSAKRKRENENRNIK